MQVFVFGMHRTGTSALTGLLRILGLHVGRPEELMPPKPDNPRGFWERQAVSDLHHEVLRELGMTWDAPLGADLDRLPEEARLGFLRRLEKEVEALDLHAQWVVKDPLLCLLFPLWRDLVREPVAILLHRSPLEVAESLRRRNGLPLIVGVALWELYSLSALEQVRGMPHVIVHHRQLMHEPLVVAEKLLSFLGDLGADLQPIPRSEIREFIDPELSYLMGAEVEGCTYLNPARERLMAAWESGEALAGGFEAVLSEDSREVLMLQQDLLGSREELEAALRARDEQFLQRFRQAQASLEVAADRARERALYLEATKGMHDEMKRFVEDRARLFEEKNHLLDEMKRLVEDRDRLFEAKNLMHDELKGSVEERARLFEDKSHMHDELKGVVEDRDRLFEAKNLMHDELKGVVEERDRLFEERNLMHDELERNAEERDRSCKEKELDLRERDALSARLEELLGNPWIRRIDAYSKRRRRGQGTDIDRGLADDS